MSYFDALIDLCQQQCFLCGTALPPPTGPNRNTGLGIDLELADERGQRCLSEERIRRNCFLDAIEKEKENEII